MNSSTRLGSLIIFLFFSLISTMAAAQDMTNVRVDELSDTQIHQFLRQVEASGLTEAQLEQVALSRGMSTDEIRKLRSRVNTLKVADPRAKQDTTLRLPTYQQGMPIDSQNMMNAKAPAQIESEAESALNELKSKIFGASLFKNSTPQFEPNLNIATPRNYVIGTGDELIIEIY